jgi:hypothetical protein
MSYTFKVSLRIYHPSMPPEEISAALSLTPRTSWAAGSSKREQQLSGAASTREWTYWSAVLQNDDSVADLPDFLSDALRTLEVHASFLKGLVQTGGRLELFVAWFLHRPNTGDVFPHSLLERLGALEMDLTLDLYREQPAMSGTLSDS